MKPQRITYSIEELNQFSISEESLNILNKSGLPKINSPYHNYFPVEKCFTIMFNNEELLVIGTPFQERKNQMEDNIFLLSLSSEKVFFLSQSFYKLGIHYNSPLTLVNDSLSGFIDSQIQIQNFIETVFLSNSELRFEKANSLYNALQLDFTSVFWQKRLSEIREDIEEKYEQLINPVG